MLDYSCVKAIIRFVVLNDYGGFVECQPHAKFKHHIGVFAAYVTNDDIGSIDILHYALLNYSDCVGITNQFDGEFQLSDALNRVGNNVFYLKPMLCRTSVNRRNGHYQAAREEIRIPLSFPSNCFVKIFSDVTIGHIISPYER